MARPRMTKKMWNEVWDDFNKMRRKYGKPPLTADEKQSMIDDLRKYDLTPEMKEDLDVLNAKIQEFEKDKATLRKAVKKLDIKEIKKLKLRVDRQSVERKRIVKEFRKKYAYRERGMIKEDPSIFHFTFCKSCNKYYHNDDIKTEIDYGDSDGFGMSSTSICPKGHYVKS